MNQPPQFPPGGGGNGPPPGGGGYGPPPGGGGYGPPPGGGAYGPPPGGGGYGPPPGGGAYGPPPGGGGYGPPPGGGGYGPPMGGMPPPGGVGGPGVGMPQGGPPKSGGPPVALIIMIVLVVLSVSGLGGCIVCAAIARSKSSSTVSSGSSSSSGVWITAQHPYVKFLAPPGWTRSLSGEWGTFRAPSGKAVLAFTTFDRPNESTVKLGRASSVLGVTGASWGSPAVGTIGPNGFPAHMAEGSCNFEGPGGTIWYATVNPGGVDQILLIYAVSSLGTKADRDAALVSIKSLQRR